ncbi:MAG: hypothetical protein C4538_04500, partial [Nitrospiraceae bacterium]
MINKWSRKDGKQSQRSFHALLSIFLIAIVVLLIPGNKPVYGGDAKYIIMFVADGWGQKHIEAVNSYTGTTPSYQSSPWVNHWVSTYPYNGGYNTSQAWSNFNYVTNGEADSACSATALYTGFKTALRRISVSSDASTAFFSIGEKAKESEMGVGAVTTVPVSHATPGAWVAHNDDRGNTYAMADEGFFGNPNTTGTTSTHSKYGGGHGPTMPPADVLIGSDGADYVSSQILTKLRNESGQLGKHILVEKQAGIDGGSALMTIANYSDTRKLAGLFDHAYRNADGTGHDPENPTLAESTLAALTVLSRNPKGFVLNIEGGAIDWGAHANNMNQMIGEAIDFDQAIQTAINWVNDPANDADWTNTLVIVTADHECGYLSAGPNVFPNQPLGTINSSTLSKEKIVADGTGRRASWEDTNANNLIDTGETVYWYWNSGGHTNSLVPLYARGTGAELFASHATNNDIVRGAYMDDTDVFVVMDSALKVQACSVTGSTSIIPGQSLYGNPVDLTSIVAKSNTVNMSYSVRETGGSCEINPAGTYIEAENYTGTITQGTGTFVKETSIAGYFGASYLRSNGGGAGTVCPPVDQGKSYQVNFQTTGTYNVWIRGYAQDKNADSIFIGLDGNCVGALRETPAGCTGTACDPYLNTWIWTNTIQDGTNTINITTPGTHTINVWVRETNHRLDGIYVTMGSETPTDGSHGLELNPKDCSIEIFNGNETAAQSVNTTAWTNGVKTLTVNGDDATCLTPLPSAADTFTFDSTPTLRDAILISSNTAIAADNPTEIDQGVIMQRFQVDSSNVADGQVELILLGLLDEGTATSILDAKVYISTTSSSTLPLDAVLIGNTGAWDGTHKTLTLNGGAASDRTVTNGISKYIYIVYDIASGQAGYTIKSVVSSVTVDSPDLGAANIGSSNLLNINDCIKTGSITINPGQSLYGNPVDLTSIVNSSNAVNMIYDVAVVSSGICTIDPEGTYFDAENFTGTISQGTGTFVLETSAANYLGTGYLRSNGGSSQSKNSCPSNDQGKKYQVKFNQTGTYRVWIRGYAGFDPNQNNDGQDSVFIGLDGTCVGALTEDVYDQWVWTNTKQSLSGQDGETNKINVTTPGIHTINVWIRDKNHLLDGIYITQGTETPNDFVHGTTINPTYCPVSIYSGNETQSQSVSTLIWTNGSKILTVTGDDATCGDQLTSAIDTFNFDVNHRPSSSITSPLDGVLLNNSAPNPFTITGTAGDDESVNHIEVSTDGGQNWNVATCPGCPGANPTWTYSWTLPANGPYNIKSRAFDNRSVYEIPGPGVNVTIQRGGPSVTSTSPINSATAIIQNSAVTINWDRDIDCTSVDETSVTISPSVGWSKTSCSGAQAVFTPSGQTILTEYTVNLSTDIKDSVGNFMAATYQFSYTTGEPTPPSSSITDPLHGSKINSSAPNPYIISGSASDNNLVAGVEISINGGAWIPVTSCTGCGTANATWTYSWNLPADGTYTLQSRAKDTSNNYETPGVGNTVTVDRTSPSVSSTIPVNGATAVALNQVVTIVWNTNVDCTTVNTGTITSNSPNWNLLVCAGNSATFTTSNQTEYTLYTVTVTTAVKNSSQVPMSDPYQFSFRTNKKPTLEITQPDGANDSLKAGNPYNITYNLSDPDHAVTAAFYYDTDGTGYDGTAISGTCASAPEGAGVTCAWDTTGLNSSGMPPKTFYIHGVTNDGHGEVKNYSLGQVTIYPPNEPPTISVSEPNGTDDTVVVGDTYNIKYTLTDPNIDDTVTAAFYYDNDNTGYNGNPISGACAAAPEGTDVTCTWNTLGMTPGSYFIYGITSDSGGSVMAYSS